MPRGPAQLPSEPAKPDEIRPQRPASLGPITLWIGTHAIWLGLFYVPWPLRLPVAYGSYLVWAVSASFVWKRQGPLWASLGFLLGTWLLQQLQSSTDEGFLVFGLTHILLWLVMGLSSLCTSLWYEYQKVLRAQKKQRDALEQELIEVARSSSLGKMTVSICHEMKNQIAVTVGYLDQLRDDIDGSSPHKRKVERSLLACDKMLKILNQLRTLARDTRSEPLHGMNMQSIIKESTHFLERHFQYHGIELHIQCSDSLPQVQGDGVLLQTILINLLNFSINGFKHDSQPHASKKAIHISCQQQDQSIAIQYGDNLLHRSDIKSAEVFDLFYHVEKKGLLEGLDLVVIHHLIHKIGGSITFHQDPKEGLRVTITLVPSESKHEGTQAFLDKPLAS